ncbi:nucleic acid-binding protein [Suillus brevipes Sb2]|nr:nucleic acid-binding protein [Suillus brevipes Sb2]
MYCAPPVSRLYARSNYDMDLTLDYNIELFLLVNGDIFAMALSSSLSRDGGAPTADGDDKDRDVWRPDGKRFGRRLYVWEGATVYKFDPDLPTLCNTAYASFGGLLLSITGSYRHLTNVVLGDLAYVLLRNDCCGCSHWKGYF